MSVPFNQTKVFNKIVMQSQHLYDYGILSIELHTRRLLYVYRF